MNSQLLKKFVLPLSLPLVASFFACSDNPSDSGNNLAGGPGSITTNGIVARVGGVPVSNASVSLHQVDYTVPEAKEEVMVVAVATTVTDSVGRFALTVPDSGEYRMTVSYDGSAYTKIVSHESYQALDSLEGVVDLSAIATLTGVADIPEGSKAVWVGVVGTDVLVRSDSNGVFFIPAIPANDTLQLYFMDDGYEEDLGRESVFLQPYEQVQYNYKTPVEIDSSVTDSSEVVADSLPKVSVLLQNGSPAAYATVALRSLDSVGEIRFVRSFMVVADKYADENGRFDMEWPKSGDYRLTVTSGSQSYSRVYSAEELKDVDSITLTTSVSYSSNVTLTADEDFAWVGVYGLDELVKTDASGAYVLPALPANDSLKVYFVHNDGTKPFVDWTVKTSKVSKSEKPSVLLYDFEEDDTRWYMSVDTLWKGSSFYKNGKADSSHKIADYLEADSSRGSTVFHGKYSVAFDPYAWVLLGTQFKETLNLSDLDSIAFYAKGDGNIRVTLENWENYDKGTKAASSWISLDSSWKRIVIKPSELCIDNDEKKDCKSTWERVKNGVRQIHFFPGCKGNCYLSPKNEVYVDDVKLYGVLF